MVPAVWYFLYLMSYYMKTSREAKVGVIGRLLELLAEGEGLGTQHAVGWFELRCCGKLGKVV